MKRLLTCIVLLAWLLILGSYAREPFEDWLNSRNFDLAKWHEAKEEAAKLELRRSLASDPEFQARIAAMRACFAFAGPERESCMTRVLSQKP